MMFRPCPSLDRHSESCWLCVFLRRWLVVGNFGLARKAGPWCGESRLPYQNPYRAIGSDSHLDPATPRGGENGKPSSSDECLRDYELNIYTLIGAPQPRRNKQDQQLNPAATVMRCLAFVKLRMKFGISHCDLLFKCFHLTVLLCVVDPEALSVGYRSEVPQLDGRRSRLTFRLAASPWKMHPKACSGNSALRAWLRKKRAHALLMRFCGIVGARSVSRSLVFEA